MKDDIKFYPPKFKNSYRHWMENFKDWCISRQLWWGHRIPAYFLPEGGYVVAETEEKALELAKEKCGNPNLTMSDLRQDEDVLDTWFSSWLWPISLFDGINNPDNEEINYYYPTSDLVTGPDIIFFWVARMIMAGYEYEGKMPFKNVYFTGIVRDKLGRKMSKSLGNSPDPLELIEKYGADGVRMGMMLSAPAGNDILFDDALCEQGRNFCNKIWNAFRLIKGWTNAKGTIEIPTDAHLAVQWFDQRLDAAAVEVADLFSKYRLSEALMLVYKLFWDEFSSWLLEIVKPAYGQPVNGFVYDMVLSSFERLLELLHPFMPFITEEIFCSLQDEEESIMVSDWPVFEEAFDFKAEENEVEIIKNAVRNIRNLRADMNVPPSKKASVYVVSEKEEVRKVFEDSRVFFATLGYASEVTIQADKTGIEKDAVSVVIDKGTIYMPFAELVDVGEIKRAKGMLSNEKFISKAPAAKVEAEKEKLEKYTSMAAQVAERLSQLKK